MPESPLGLEMEPWALFMTGRRFMALTSTGSVGRVRAGVSPRGVERNFRPGIGAKPCPRKRIRCRVRVPRGCAGGMIELSVTV